MTKQLILIIEDDPALLHLYSAMIVNGGYEVIAVPDASAALESLRHHTPDLIIEDLSLPDLNGVQLVHCIRQLPHVVDVPVIILSGSPGRIESARQSAEHFVAFLSKPVTQLELLANVRKYLHA